MRTLAEQIVADDPSKLPEGETQVTQENYFRIVSMERLGTEQTVQFRSENEPAATWGVHESAFASAPRSFHRGDNIFGSYYNAFARSAESDDAGDSVCPHGWQLPKPGTDQNDNKSWYQMLGLETDYSGQYLASDFILVRKTPILIVTAGRVQYASGAVGNTSASSYATSRMDRAFNGNLNNTEGLKANDIVYREYGLTVRCLKS